MSTWTPNWPPSQTEVFRDHGYASCEAQLLESNLLTLLLAAETAGRIKFDKKKDIESELWLSQKTLGGLITELKKGGTSEDLHLLLTEAKTKRNDLTHHFFIRHAVSMDSEEGREKMLRELQNIRFKIGRARIVIEQFNEEFIERVFGLSKKQIRVLYEEQKKKQG